MGLLKYGIYGGFNPLTPELQEMVGNERLLKIFNSYHAHMTKWLNLVSAYLGFSTYNCCTLQCTPGVNGKCNIKVIFVIFVIYGGLPWLLN
jgi:hypothetical protein